MEWDESLCCGYNAGSVVPGERSVGNKTEAKPEDVLSAEPGERAWTRLGFIFLGCRDYRVLFEGFYLVLWLKIEGEIFFFLISDFFKKTEQF